MKVKGKIIRDARLKKEFSQEYIADTLKISQSKYSRLEKGDLSFDIIRLSMLIDVLEINPMDVFEFTEKQKVFIKSYYSGNIHSKLSDTDKEVIRELINEELRKTQ